MTKLDRRVQRTRGLLCNALLSLIVERGYDSLKIEDITERANLRRATFYMHYRDKEELLLAALTETFDGLVSAIQSTTSSDLLGGKTEQAAFLITLRHIEDNYQLYRTITMGSASEAISPGSS